MWTMTRIAAVVIVGGVASLGACGGETFESTAEGGVAGAGGSGTGGAGGHGGSGGSQAGTGGAGATGGTGAGGAGGCPPCAGMACPPGWVEKPTPDGCCYTCEPPSVVCNPAGSCALDIGCADGEYFNFAGDCCACRPWSCDGTTCAEPVCGDGAVMEFPAGSCCAVCSEPFSACDAGTVPCEQVVCPPGQAQVGPGNGCCSGCAPATQSCDTAAADYLLWLEERISLVGATNCNSTADCTVTTFSNACYLDCGTAIAAGYADSIALEAIAYGDDHCAGCPQSGVSCPAVVLMATCDAGRCRLQ